MGASRIVVNADDWTTSDSFFTASAETLTVNVFQWLTYSTPNPRLLIDDQFDDYLSYTRMLSALTAHGFTVVRAPTSTWTSPLLADFAAVLVELGQVDDTMLTSYVNNGGGVYIVGGNSNADLVNNYNRFLMHFGISFVYPPVPGAFNITDFVPHPVTRGVTQLNTLGPTPIIGPVVLSTQFGMNWLAAYSSPNPQDAPVAMADFATTPEEMPLTLAVLANDTDPDGGTLTVAAISQGDHGAVSTDGTTVTYTPASNFNGPDTFTYTIYNSQGETATATVTVTVTPVHDTPVAVADFAATPEEVPLTLAVLANDTDPDGGTLTVAAVSQGGHGAVSTDGTTVTYTPASNFTGPDIFTYTVHNGRGETATATVTVVVGVGRIVVNADDWTTDDSFFTASAETLTVNVFQWLTYSTPNPRILVDDQFDQHPATSYDRMLSTLTAHGFTVVRAPTSTWTSPLLAGFTAVLVQFGLVDDTMLTSYVNNGGGVYIVAGSGGTPIANYNGFLMHFGMSLGFPPVDVLGFITDFVPHPVTRGVSQLYVAGPNPITLTAPGSMLLSTQFGMNWLAVFPADNTHDAPVAMADTATTPEETPLRLAVLANDTDPDGGTLTVAAISQGGYGAVSTDGTTVTYTPAGNFTGPDTFTYTVRNSWGETATATDTVTVTPVNDAPEVTNPEDQVHTAEATVTLQIIAHDPEDNSLTFEAANLPPGLDIDAATGLITGKIADTGVAHSPFTVTIMITDNGLPSQSTSVTFTWTIAPVALSIITPQDDDVIAGKSIAVAARVVLMDIESILFQFRPLGTAEWQVIGMADAPRFLVAWDTTHLANGLFELRALATPVAGELLPSPLIEVIIDNTDPAAPPDIVEDATMKSQALQADVATLVITAAGTIVDIPARALPVDDRIIVETVDIVAAPGVPPGDIAGMLVDASLASGLETFTNPITISLAYPDTDQDGIVDGTDIVETALTLWFFDADAEAWIQIPNAVVRTESNVIEGQVEHLTLFGVFHARAEVPRPPLTVVLGDRSPTAAAQIIVVEPMSNTPVLQVRLDTATERIHLDRVTISLLEPAGNETLAKLMRVKLLDDGNGNGRVDTDEEILAETDVTDMATAIPLTITPPFVIDPASTVHLLVALDCGTNYVKTANILLPFVPRAPLEQLGVPGSLPWVLGLVLGLGVHRRRRWFSLGMLVVVLCWSLLMAGCPSEETETLAFTVAIPAQGIHAQGAASGLVTGPDTQLISPRITVLSTR